MSGGIYGLLGLPYPVPMPHTAGYHEEALLWQRRVNANSGIVLPDLLRAVSRFCYMIDAVPGLRSRFVRLNLFCGQTLTTSLVPLYLGASIGAATIGNATDTNANFVAADQTATGGLKGNGSNKYIDTGVIPSTSLTFPSAHLCTHVFAGAVSGTFRVNIGSNQVGGTGPELALYQIGASLTTPLSAVFDSVNAANTAVNNPTGTLCGVCYSTVDYRIYRNGFQDGKTITALGQSSYPSSRSIFVFARNSNGTASLHSDARLGLYSIGAALTETQVAGYAEAVAAFNQATGRS